MQNRQKKIKTKDYGGSGNGNGCDDNDDGKWKLLIAPVGMG